MRAGWAVVVLLAACGRIDFTPSGDDASAMPGDDASGLPSGLVAWYRLDELGGATGFADAIGHHDGACTPPKCPAAGMGHLGNAFVFDGIDDCIMIPDDGQLTLQAVTVAIWARQDAVRPCSQVTKRVDVGATVLDEWEIETYAADNTLALVTTHATTQNNVLMSAAGVIQIGAWQHLAASYDGMIKRLYLDGALIGTLPIGSFLTHDTHEMTIGCDDNGTSIDGLFVGALDDVQVYDHALTDAEITQLSSR